MLYGLAVFAVLLVLWGIAWQYQIRLAFGILIGLSLGAVLARFIGPYESMAEIPAWLPATPVRTVVILLFILGILAWRAPDIGEPGSDDTH